MPLMTHQDILDMCTDIFVKNNASPAVAKRVAQALVRAEIDEQFGHGLVRMPTYVGQLRSGKIDGHAEPTAKRVRPGFFHISASGGFAYPALDLAVKSIEDNIKEQGVIVAGINQSHHCGVAGHLVEDLANKGMIALLLSNTPKAIAPWGGKKALFGTNPLAFAAGDVVIDMATSVIARGKLIGARNRGEKIPTDWAIDVDGNPTDDPAKAIEGCILPFGGAKGYTLILMIEILTAVLCQAALSNEASSFLDEQGDSPNVGQFILAIDKNILDGDLFDERLAYLLGEIKAQDNTRIPGEKRRDVRDKHKDGLNVSDDIYEQLCALRDESGGQ